MPIKIITKHRYPRLSFILMLNTRPKHGNDDTKLRLRQDKKGTETLDASNLHLIQTLS